MKLSLLIVAGWGLWLGGFDLPRQSDLDGAAAAFARAWLAEDMGAVAETMSGAGVSLHLAGQDHPALAVRQARVALRDFLDTRSTRRLDVSRVVDLGGAPARGFAEVRWETVVDRTSESLVLTVFVSFERADAVWQITEIRVL